MKGRGTGALPLWRGPSACPTPLIPLTYIGQHSSPDRHQNARPPAAGKQT
jgi:hypothetical protein